MYMIWYMNSIEFPFSPNIRTGTGADPSMCMFTAATKEPPMHPSNAPGSSPCAIPTATCPLLCRLVPSLVAHNLSEISTLKDSNRCFFSRTKMSVNQGSTQHMSRTWNILPCPQNNLILKGQHSWRSMINGQGWLWQWCQPLIGGSWRVYLGSSNDFKLLGPLAQKKHATLKRSDPWEWRLFTSDNRTYLRTEDINLPKHNNLISSSEVTQKLFHSICVDWSTPRGKGKHQNMFETWNHLHTIFFAKNKQTSMPWFFNYAPLALLTLIHTACNKYTHIWIHSVSLWLHDIQQLHCKCRFRTYPHITGIVTGDRSLHTPIHFPTFKSGTRRNTVNHWLCECLNDLNGTQI